MQVRFARHTDRSVEIIRFYGDVHRRPAVPPVPCASWTTTVGSRRFFDRWQIAGSPTPGLPGAPRTLAASRRARPWALPSGPSPVSRETRSSQDR